MDFLKVKEQKMILLLFLKVQHIIVDMDLLKIIQKIKINGKIFQIHLEHGLFI